MSDDAPADEPEIEHGQLLTPDDQPDEPQKESVEEPAKVMRIGSMIKQLLEEVRDADLDDGGRERLKEIYDQSVTELSQALSEDLADELRRLTSPLSDTPASMGEVRIAQAQLVGWLEGLFHGIQATLFAQQMAARQQLEQMRRGELAPGRAPGQSSEPPPGTYL